MGWWSDTLLAGARRGGRQRIPPRGYSALHGSPPSSRRD